MNSEIVPRRLLRRPDTELLALAGNLRGYRRNRQSVQEESEISNYACRFAVATISAVTSLPISKLNTASRSTIEIAYARQIAMYLAHTKFGVSYADVGGFFNRNRSTVAHACQVIEDQRDERDFDDHLSRMEYLIDAAMPITPEILKTLSKRHVGEMV